MKSIIVIHIICASIDPMPKQDCFQHMTGCITWGGNGRSFKQAKE